MSIEANKRIVRNFMAAIAAQNWHEMAELMTEDGTWVVPGDLPISGPYNRTALITMMQGMGERFASPVAFNELGMISEGDKVAVECSSEIDTKDGKQYRNRYHMLFEMRDGKIAQMREYCDTKHVYDVFLT